MIGDWPKNGEIFHDETMSGSNNFEYEAPCWTVFPFGFFYWGILSQFSICLDSPWSKGSVGGPASPDIPSIRNPLSLPTASLESGESW